MVSAPPPPVALGLLRGYSSGSSPLVSSPSSAGSVSGVGPFPARYGVGVSEISGRESGGSGFDPTWLLRRARRVRRFFRSHIGRWVLFRDRVDRLSKSSVMRRSRSALCFSLRGAGVPPRPAVASPRSAGARPCARLAIEAPVTGMPGRGVATEERRGPRAGRPGPAAVGERPVGSHRNLPCRNPERKP